MIGYQPLELLGCVLAAAVGVMQQGARLAPAPDRHHQRVGDELRRHGCAHRPAHHTPGEQIDHRRNVQPAFGRPDVSEIGNPFAVRSGRFKAAVEHVGRDGAGLPLTQIGRQPAPSRTRFKPVVAHQSLNAMQAADSSIFDQIVPHPPGPIGPVAGQEARADLGSQLFVAAAVLAARPRQPGVEATARDTERPAQPYRRPDHPVLRDEGELHVLSFAM